MTLQEIGLKYGTDKATTHFYLDNYEKYLGSWRDKEFMLLEIGVGNGSSIKMWREYFPNAKVYGIDINPDCAGEGIFIGNIIDVTFWKKAMEEIGSPDIVIDDGGHVGLETFLTFKNIFPLVRSGGFYFVEDTATFYNNHYSGAFESNGRAAVYNFFADMPYHVDVAGRGMCGNQDFAINHPTTEPPVPEYSRLLKAIHIHPSLWSFERK